MKTWIKFIAIFALLFLAILFINGCKPLSNFFGEPGTWPGQSFERAKFPGYDAGKKTVFIVADNKLTQQFDMLTPFYLFNATGKVNVYIVAKEKTPILLKRDLFVSPQLTFREADSLQLTADVIVLPALSKRDEHQDTEVIAWIKKHFTQETKMLTICDGASTGAATGFYDGKPITCHASDFEAIKAHFSKPAWVQDVSVTKYGNLFSTAGVSNAVDGSLLVIEELFGKESSQSVSFKINYPHAETRLSHRSIALDGSNKFAVLKKVFFKRNRKIGVLIENGMDEFAMTSILETYSRTFPASFETVILDGSTIQTKYGLSLICTSKNQGKGLDELHVITPGTFSKEKEDFFKDAKIIRYDNLQNQYLVDVYLKRIGEQYGPSFEKFVKVSMDYN